MELKFLNTFIPKKGTIFFLAGLWDKWNSPVNGEVETFTVITKDASENFKEIHHRMPLILSLKMRSIGPQMSLSWMPH